MAKYETMLVTTATLDEEATAALVGKFKSLIEANGTIDSVEDWGKRRLAYPINKENEGVDRTIGGDTDLNGLSSTLDIKRIPMINITSEADFPAELDRVYKITDGVLRSMIVAKEEAVPAKAETEAK